MDFFFNTLRKDKDVLSLNNMYSMYIQALYKEKDSQLQTKIEIQMRNYLSKMIIEAHVTTLYL